MTGDAELHCAVLCVASVSRCKNAWLPRIGTLKVPYMVQTRHWESLYPHLFEGTKTEITR